MWRPPVADEELSTSCRGCFFAQVENGKQTGCDAGMFEVLKETGALAMDGDYFRSVKRFCPFYRPESWAKGMGTQQAIREVQKERQLEVAAVVCCDGRTADDVKITLDRLNNQTMPVRQVVFVTTPRPGVRPQDIVALLRDSRPKFEWSIRSIVDETYTEFDAAHEGAIDARGVYLLFCVAGFHLNYTTIEDLDHQVNWLNRRVALVDSFHMHGTIVQANIYGMVGGWAEVEWEGGDRIVSVAEKIKRIAQAQKSSVVIVEGTLPHEA